MSRDQELDDLQRLIEAAENDAAGKPFIHRPDALDIRDGMVCWLDGTRVCGPDCVAFNAETLEEDGSVPNTPNQCLVLLYMGQQGAAAMATVAVSRKRIQEVQDRRRQEMQGPPPPDPTGGSR